MKGKRTENLTDFGIVSPRMSPTRVHHLHVTNVFLSTNTRSENRNFLGDLTLLAYYESLRYRQLYREQMGSLGSPAVPTKQLMLLPLGQSKYLLVRDLPTQ